MLLRAKDLKRAGTAPAREELTFESEKQTYTLNLRLKDLMEFPQEDGPSCQVEKPFWADRTSQRGEHTCGEVGRAPCDGSMKGGRSQERRQGHPEKTDITCPC